MSIKRADFLKFLEMKEIIENKAMEIAEPLYDVFLGDNPERMHKGWKYREYEIEDGKVRIILDAWFRGEVDDTYVYIITVDSFLMDDPKVISKALRDKMAKLKSDHEEAKATAHKKMLEGLAVAEKETYLRLKEKYEKKD